MLPLEDRELLNQTMVGLNIDPDTIASLMASFDKAATSVETDKLVPVQSAAFGGSFTGGYRLGTNTEMAWEAEADALKAMAAGFRGLSTSVEQFSKDMEQTTEQTAATMNLIQSSTDCVASPTFDPGDACTLPTGDEG